MHCEVFFNLEFLDEELEMVRKVVNPCLSVGADDEERKKARRRLEEGHSVRHCVTQR